MERTGYIREFDKLGLSLRASNCRDHEPTTHIAAGGGTVGGSSRHQVVALYLRNADPSYRSHKSIIAYLQSANLPNSSNALREELADSIQLDDATAKKYEGLLEKKWTSVVRLQKKVSFPLLAGFMAKG